VGQDPKFVKKFIKEFRKNFVKYQEYICWFLEEFWSFFTYKISYLRFETQKSGSCSTFSPLCPTTSYQLWGRRSENKKCYTNDPNNSDKLLKMEKKLRKCSIKHFEKFRLFIITGSCIFPTLHSEIQYRQCFWCKTKKLLFSNCLFCCNIVFTQP